MTPTSSLRERDTPQLLALPTEIKLQIIAYLSREKSPNLACLRRTHTSFLNIIHKSEIRSKTPSSVIRSQLLDTELNHPNLLPLNHYPCYACTAVLSAHNFHPYLTHSKLAIAGSYAYERFCSRCALQNPGPEEYLWRVAGPKQLKSQPGSAELRRVESRSSTPFFPEDH